MTPRVLFIVAFLLLIVGAAPVSAQANTADTLLLAARIAGGAAGQTQVTVDALPPNWVPTIPLPANIPVLGSLSGQSPGFISIFYRPSDARAAFGAYVAQLKAAGFTDMYPQTNVATQSGFIATPPALANQNQNFKMLCHDGQGLYVRLGAATDDLRLDVPPKRGFPCGGPQGIVAYAPRPESPLPRFNPPTGTTFEPLNSNSMGMGAAGALESVSSAAIVNGNVTFGAVLSSMLSQLKAAGWSIASQLAGSDSAIATLRVQRGQEHWLAWLSILKGIKPQTYSVHIDALKTGLPSYRTPAASLMGATSVPNLNWVPAKISKTDEPVALQLLRRIVTGNGYRPAQIYFKQIPPGFNERVPLPQATPLAGSIVQLQPSEQGQRQYTIYYRLSRSQLQAYDARLTALGWKLQPSVAPNLNGFQFTYFPVSQYFCSDTLPPISVLGAMESNAVTISVPRIRPQFSCDTMQNMLPWQVFHNPLPRLEAPDGVTMLLANAGVRAGTNGAVLTTTQPIGQLLDTFTSRFTQKGWTLAASTTVPDLGSRSYTYRDTQNHGQRWQAVLTLYRSFADAGTYYAFLDLTKLPIAK